MLFSVDKVDEDVAQFERIFNITEYFSYIGCVLPQVGYLVCKNCLKVLHISLILTSFCQLTTGLWVHIDISDWEQKVEKRIATK